MADPTPEDVRSSDDDERDNKQYDAYCPTCQRWYSPDRESHAH